MRHLLLACCLATGAAHGAVQPPPEDVKRLADLTAEQRRTLEDGKVLALSEQKSFVDRKGARVKVLLAILVGKPPEAVYQTVYDIGRFPEFMPFVTRTTRLTRTDGEAGVTDEVWKLEFTVLFVKDSYQAHHLNDPHRGRVEWRLDESVKNGLKTYHGHWQMVPLDDGKRTVIFYDAEIESRFPIPAALEKMVYEIQVKDFLRNTRRRAESEGRWSKRGTPDMPTAEGNPRP